MTKQITLNRGAPAVVDDEDFDRLAKYKWFVNAGGHPARGVYADHAQKVVLMHSHLLVPRDGFQIGHVDGDPLNCQRSNLVYVPRYSQTVGRNKASKGKSGMRGVAKQGDRWRAYVYIGKKQVALGTFESAEDAARVVDKAARERSGVFAFQNFPDEVKA